MQSIAELIQSAHASQYPDGAIGVSLDALSKLTGTVRKTATHSSVRANVRLDLGTYAIGSLIAHVAGDPAARFYNRDEIINTVGDDTTFTNRYFTAQVAGPVHANIDTLTVIAEPVVGWDSINNPTFEATLGTLEETDAELRLRRQLELITGSASTDAIRTALSQMTDVVWVSVYENVTSEVDDDGIPAHGMRVVVHAPAAATADIARTIYDSKPAGIATDGQWWHDIPDSLGRTHRVYFSRAAVVPVYVELDIEIVEESYAGDSDLADAIATHGDEVFGVGDDISIAQIINAAFSGVGGVRDILAVRVGRSASPTQTTNLLMTINEIGDLSAARILINTTSV